MQHEHEDVQRQLQAEFCPPLDTSLVAAFVSELELDANKQPPAAALAEIRETLAALAAQADHQALAESFADVTLADGAIDGIDNLPALYADDSSSARDTTTTGSTSLSSADAALFDSPLGFLRAAFPHIEGAALAAALATACGDADADAAADVDMEAVVGELLSAEYIRELAERGLDPDAVPDDSPWVTVGTQRAPAPRKPKPPKPRATSLTDVRQAHHRRAPTAMRPAPDPWIQVQSLAARLTELLPDHSPGFFASYFHSPAHATPAAAVRAALGTLAGDAAQAELPQKLLPTYFTLFELLSTEDAFAALDPPRRACVLEDAQLVLAAGAAPDAALDVVHLLRDLDDDDDAASGVLGMYHSPAPTPPPSPALSRAAAAGVPPPLTHPPPALLPAPPPAPPAKKHAGGWQHVPERKAARGPSAYASHIPAYQPLYSAAGTRAGGNAAGKGGKGDLGEIRARRKVADLQRRRDAALREATRAWSNGSVRNRGGDVALFFAERARELQEAAKREQLNATRSMVEARRRPDRRDVDLHGATASEAVVIVREILLQEPCSPANPLTVITGKGTHSAGGVGVLGPAVKSALVADGWHLSQRDGALIVRGRSGRGP